MNQYEGMFLFDPTFGGNFESCEAEIRRLMERAGAELLFCKKWDERRLAFKVKGRKRGLYVLTYFKAAADKISPLEHDCQIAENILRILVLRADGVTPDMMEKVITAHGAELGPPPTRKPGEMEPVPDMVDVFADDRGRRDGFRNKGGRRPATTGARD